MFRRDLFTASALFPLALLGCTTTGGTATVSLTMVQDYSNDVIDALCAAAQTYVVSPSARNVNVVNQLVLYLQQSKTAIDNVTVAANAQGIALQIVGFAQQLSPIVMTFLGPAAPFVPLGLAVLQAFIQSLPPPPAAPEKPPAELHEAALKYRAK